MLVDLHVIDLLDILLVAGVVWAALRWLRVRARHVLFGLVVLGGSTILARQLGLQLTAWVLQGFFVLAVVVVVIVFQDDLRRIFEQIGRWGFRPPTRRAPPQLVETLVRTVAQLAGARRGALLVFPGSDPLERHLEGGVFLDARVSEPLLLSLFDPHSPGHDGAVLLRGEGVLRFGIHLPLSTDRSQLGSVGTRHAAALGLAERSDALCVVVSEERGVISVAHEGRLRQLAGPEPLADELRSFLGSRRSVAGRRQSPLRRLASHWPEAAQAMGVAVVLWLVFVPGSTLTRVTRTAAIQVDNLPPGWVLEEVDPGEIEVTISGRRRDVYLSAPDDLEVRVDALLAQLGRRTFEISADQVHHSGRGDVIDVQPSTVKLSLRREEAETDS
ncbi:MAG: diadenylate cyclase [Myxococcota bacterium]